MKGSFWLGLGSGGEQGLRFLRNIILARILAPDAFGLMAIILAVNAAFESFTQIGIKEAIIQNPRGEEQTYLNGAWFMSFGRSILLFTGAVISAYWVAYFYEIQQHVLLVQTSFAVILLNGSVSAGAYIALKRLEYKKWVVITHGGGMIGVFTAISLSVVLENVWALVLGFVAEALMRNILSYIICPYTPRFQFDRDHLHSLIRYARGMFGIPILYFIYAQMDIFVIGKLYPKNDLGLYSMAASLAQAPSMIMTTLVNPILMPVFSKKQSDSAWINDVILRSTKMILIAGAPLIVFAVFYSEDLLKAVYGKQYAVMAVPFAVLLANTIVRSASIPIANVYLAMGRPELNRNFTGLRTILIIASIYPAIKWFGLPGAAMAVFLSSVISTFPQVRTMNRLTGLPAKSFIKIFMQTIMIFCIVGVIIYTIRNLWPSSAINNLIQGVAICVTCYGVMVSIYLKNYGLRSDH